MSPVKPGNLFSRICCIVRLQTLVDDEIQCQVLELSSAGMKLKLPNHIETLHDKPT